MSFVVTEEHRQIFQAAGHVLITGNPGSGKTATALQKAKWHIDKGGLEPGQQVLFLSFSNAAVGRIVETAALELTSKGYQKQLTIQTFHSLFWGILRTHGYLLGSRRRLRVLMPADEAALRLGRAIDDPAWLTEQREQFELHGRVCFDLFAPLTLQLFERSKAISGIYARKYPLIIIDEAQDTGTDQWACIRHLADASCVIALADLDQQIYDYRKDVSLERVDQIVQRLKPIEVSLAGRNHRSSRVEIMTFARDVMNDSPRSGSYSGVSRQVYSPKAESRDKKIRQSVGILYAELEKTLGSRPESVAILATWGKGVKIISNALRGDGTQKEISHRVQFDENSTYLSSRVIAFLLEPKLGGNNVEAATAIDLMATHRNAAGDYEEASKFHRWKNELMAGTVSKRSKVVPTILEVINQIKRHDFTGVPERDWTWVRQLLLSSNCGAVETVGKDAEYLMAFNRGKRISGGLSRAWEDDRTYRNARSILDSAIAETQIVSENQNQRGVNVMTIHKAKGKEFDGVIVFQNPHSSPFIARGDSAPFARSRKLLFVGITRARYHTLLLTDASSPCQITSTFQL